MQKEITVYLKSVANVLNNSTRWDNNYDKYDFFFLPFFLVRTEQLVSLHTASGSKLTRKSDNQTTSEPLSTFHGDHLKSVLIRPLLSEQFN